MADDEKRRVAFHEAGHTLVALSVPHADPVHRVTVIPRSIGALGVTLQLPTDERYVLTREELEGRLFLLLGGRTAEEIACGTISHGRPGRSRAGDGHGETEGVPLRDERCPRTAHVGPQ